MADFREDLLSRPLSVRFSTKSLKRISHEDVLTSITSFIDKKQIKSLQITENECIITLSTEDVKNKVILHGLRIQNRYIYITDVEKIITNVTVKDAPYEMPDIVLMQALSKFGEVIENSFVHGKIKGTDIENRSRYIKILNCVPLLPYQMDIGRFTVRLFADNNRTKCKYCGATNHPYFKCQNKPDQRSRIQPSENRLCHNCKRNDHLRKNCPFDIICRYCKQEGHSQNNCPNEKNEERSPEIVVTDDAQENRWETSSFGTTLDETPHSPSLLDTHTPNIVKTPSQSFYIIGDSNTNRLNVTEENIYNKSVPGLSLNNCEDVIESVKDSNISGLVIHLGTNDITRNVRNSVVSTAKCALKAARKKWPECPVAFSSIIPRKGNSASVKRINSDAKFVNQKILQYCKGNGYHYLDNDGIFMKGNKLEHSLYDAGDSTGIHISESGAYKLYINMTAFFIDGISDEKDITSNDTLTYVGRRSHSDKL